MALNALTIQEREYYLAMRENVQAEISKEDKNKIHFEFGNVGAGIGGGFVNTQELKVMKYKEALKTKDKESWIKAIEEEHERMMKHKVWIPVKKSDVPKGAKILSSTWAMKKKADGTFRARMNARGFE
jgi:hypothetical protein